MNRKTTLLLLTFLLCALAALPALAQEDDALPPPDEPVGKEVVVSRELTADGLLRTQLDIPVSRDTFISSNQPNSNFGTAANVQLGFSLGGQNLGAMRPLLYYDLSSIPKGAHIESAELRIYLSGFSPNGDSSMPFQARYLNSDWNENTVTWNSHQPEWGSVFGQGNASTTLGWNSTNVTALVNEWVNNGRSNYGLTVIGDERPDQNRQRLYFAKEAGNGLASRMIVNFTQQNDDTPPVATVKPLPQWSPANFTVSWEGHDPNNSDGSPGSGINYYDVWYSTNNGSTWIVWRAQVKTTTTNFDGGQHLQFYDFTARAVDKAGNVQQRQGSQARTQVDAEAPVVSMNPLPQFTTSSTFVISWGGTDSGSGIANYDVQWRVDGGPWQNLLEDTTQTSYQAVGAQSGALYEFQARGTDNVGNHQSFNDIPQASTTVMLAPHSIITQINPVIVQRLDGPTAGDSSQIFWEGFTAPGTSITGFDVTFRRPGNSTWLSWLQNTQQTNGTYVFQIDDEDGVYDFEVIARNSLGQTEPVKQQPDGAVVLDRHAPFVEPQMLLPIVFDMTDSS